MLRKISVIMLIGISLLFAAPAEVSLKGTVKKADGTAINGAKVFLASDTTTKVSSNADGKFALEIVKTLKPFGINVQRSFDVAGQGTSLNFSVNSTVPSGVVTLFSGNGRIVKNIPLKNLSAGTHSISLAGISNGFFILQITLGDQTVRRRVITAGTEVYVSDYETGKIETSSEGKLAKVTAAVDTLIATKEGFVTRKTPIDTYVKENIAIVMEEEASIECALPDLPASSGLTKVNEKLPDPFTFYNGTKLTKKSQWACRRKEILAMAEKYLYGQMPPEKGTEITGSVSSNKITATVKYNSKTVDLSWNTSGSGEILCLVTGSGISPSNCRKIELSHNANPISSLYGYSGVTGTISMAWQARVICAVVKQNPDKGINPAKIMVTGCSGAGKIAMTTGAFCEDIALTVIVESGGGGAASFRMAEWYRHGAGGSSYKCGDKPQGIDNLEDNGLGGPWVSQSAAGWVRSSPSKVKNLPFDQHLVLACIAPRPVCHVTNQHGANEWCHLGGTCEALSAWAAEPVWNAMGVPENFGFLMYTESSAPMHCSNPTSATNLAKEFFKRVFEGDKTAKTDVWTANDSDLQQPKSQWKDMWVDWNMETTLE